MNLPKKQQQNTNEYNDINITRTSVRSNTKSRFDSPTSLANEKFPINDVSSWLKPFSVLSPVVSPPLILLLILDTAADADAIEDGDTDDDDADDKLVISNDDDKLRVGKYVSDIFTLLTLL